MPRFRTARVEKLLSERRGLQRFAVVMDDGARAKAYALTDLVGSATVGDRVICNTTAVDLGLGTGGWHVVHWNTTRSEFDSPGPDHVMKLRYTSLQTDVGTSELLHPRATDAALGRTPVVVCTLHSQMAMVALGFAHGAPGSRLAYVMTDGASLPLVLSDLVAHLRQHELLVGSVTAGNAFGGDLEAVTPVAAFGLAKHVLRADAIVVCMGPGVVGTGTAMGTTATEAASLLDAAEAREGLPILCVRASEGDPRPRHRGISHHVHSTLQLTHCTPLVADVPRSVHELEGITAVETPDLPDPRALLDAYALDVTTMGRRYEEDRVFFSASVAAGVLAARYSGGTAPGQG